MMTYHQEHKGDPDMIRSALYTQAPVIEFAGRTGSSHWSGIATVYTETGETYLVTGYDFRNPRLSACAQVVPVQISSIYEVFDRDHPAIAALHMKNAPHCHYSGA